MRENPAPSSMARASVASAIILVWLLPDLAFAAVVNARAPTPPPSVALPSVPPPLWPQSWACFNPRPNLNLQDPLDGEGKDNRCGVRYNTLQEAKIACVQRAPEWCVCDATNSRTNTQA